MDIKRTKTLTEKAKTHEVELRIIDEATGKRFYTVISGNSEHLYTVELNDQGHRIIAKCDCTWGQQGVGVQKSETCCSHSMAVVQAYGEDTGFVPSFWSEEDDAKRQKRHIEYVGDGVWMTERRDTKTTFVPPVIEQDAEIDAKNRVWAAQARRQVEINAAHVAASAEVDAWMEEAGLFAGRR